MEGDWLPGKWGGGPVPTHYYSDARVLTYASVYPPRPSISGIPQPWKEIDYPEASKEIEEKPRAWPATHTVGPGGDPATGYRQHLYLESSARSW